MSLKVSWLVRLGSNLFRSPPSNGFNVVIVLARSQWYQLSHKYNGYIVLLKGIIAYGAQGRILLHGP